jgi:hypothetical protein
MWIESRMLCFERCCSLSIECRFEIVYQNQLFNVPWQKLTTDALTFLVELSSDAYCKSVLSEIRGYHRSMPMDILFTFPGNYFIGEGNTINKFISFSLWLLNASCRLIKSLKRYGSSICSENLLVHHYN